jgi:hypothetical protein
MGSTLRVGKLLLLLLLLLPPRDPVAGVLLLILKHQLARKLCVQLRLFGLELDKPPEDDHCAKQQGNEKCARGQFVFLFFFFLGGGGKVSLPQRVRWGLRCESGRDWDRSSRGAHRPRGPDRPRPSRRQNT